MKRLVGTLNSLAPIITRYVGIGIQFLIVVAIARTLPMADAGIYLSLSGGVQATFFAAGVGIPDGLVRTFGELGARGDAARARALMRRGVSRSVGLTVALAIGASIAGVVATGSMMLGGLFGAWWLCYGLMFITAQALVAVGRGRTGAAIFYGLINTGLLVVLVPSLLVGLVDSLVGALTFTVLGAAGSLVFAILILSRTSSPLMRREGTSTAAQLGETFSIGAVIALNRVLQGALIWSPVWIAGALYGPATAALIAVASRLAGVVGAALAAVNFSIRPDIVRLAVHRSFNKVRRQLVRVSAAATCLVFVAWIANFLIGAEAIARLFGRPYETASTLLAILLIASLAEALSGASAEVARMIGSPMWLLIVQVCFALIATAGQVAFGSRFGPSSQIAFFALCMSLYYGVVAHRAYRLVQTVSLEQTRG